MSSEEKAKAPHTIQVIGKLAHLKPLLEGLLSDVQRFKREMEPSDKECQELIMEGQWPGTQ